jgi:uncharacterized protein YggT (Ycf19 family)
MFWILIEIYIGLMLAFAFLNWINECLYLGDEDWGLVAVWYLLEAIFHPFNTAMDMLDLEMWDTFRKGKL